MYAADKVSIYDGAPIEGYSPPIETEKPELITTDAMSITSQEYGDPYIIDKSLHQAQDAITSHMQHDTLQAEGGPLQGELRDWVEQRIAWHTGSNKLLQLRSWWSVLTANTKVPKHTHTYQTKRKTVSGIVWVQGDICPLYVQVPGDELNQINNVPGRCAVFSAQTEHWTDPYPHGTTRAGISFDFCIQDQECCACKNEEFCFRCIHLTKNLTKAGIDTIYTGGSTTIKANVKSAIIRNPLINRLPKAYK